jgi:hypothetical protein
MQFPGAIFTFWQIAAKPFASRWKTALTRESPLAMVPPSAKRNSRLNSGQVPHRPGVGDVAPGVMLFAAGTQA